MRLALLSVLVLELLLRADAAAAALIHDHSAVDINGAYGINRSHEAQGFRVTTPATITKFSVWLAESSFAAADDGFLEELVSLSWGLYLDNQGKPGTLLKQGFESDPVMIDTPHTFVFGGDIMRVDLMINYIAHRPGVYWFALHEGDWGEPNSRNVDWLASNLPGTGFDGLSTASQTQA